MKNICARSPRRTREKQPGRWELDSGGGLAVTLGSVFAEERSQRNKAEGHAESESTSENLRCPGCDFRRGKKQAPCRKTGLPHLRLGLDNASTLFKECILQI